MPLIRHAWAKINLTLRVTGRRADGYHLLDSLVVFAAIGDELAFEPAADLTLTIDGRFADKLAATSDNLVLRAARRLAAACEVAAGARIHLRKNLPVAAGIGGGSSDAAQTLLGLRQLWGLDLDDGALADLALPLGADLPVCLHGRASRISGIGEVVSALGPPPQLWLVLVNPGISLATPEVFGCLGGTFHTADNIADLPADSRALARLLAASGNDLEAAACRLCPRISDVLAALDASDGCLLARMSGSGATCFGLYARQAEAEAAAATLARPDWWSAAAALRA